MFVCSFELLETGRFSFAGSVWITAVVVHAALVLVASQVLLEKTIPSEQSPVEANHLRISGARLAVTFSLLSTFVLFTYAASPASPCAPPVQLLVTLSPIVLSPFLCALWRMRPMQLSSIDASRTLIPLVPWTGLFMLWSLIVGLADAQLAAAVAVAEFSYLAVLAMIARSCYGIERSRRHEIGWARLVVRSIAVWSALLLLVLIFAVPFLLRNRSASPESTASALLRTIATAQMTYRSSHDGAFAGNFGELVSAGLVDHSFERQQVNGYRFELSLMPSARFVATARPIHYKVTGCRSFIISEDGVLRATEEERPPMLGDPLFE
jgi:hypothetical protein